MSSLKCLTAGIVDYAGLFPPAGLDMATVVKNYDEYVASAENGMLARLIVPAGRLVEFESAAIGLLPTQRDSEPWRISALVPPFEDGGQAFLAGISDIQQFNSRHAEHLTGRALVDVIEVKASTNEQILATSQATPEALSAFLEIPVELPPNSLIKQINLLADGFGRTRFFAKIRTGGVKPEMIPSIADVARFIVGCGEHLLPFKATAGLHHPVRGEFSLTYEPDAERGVMHGFLNVFVAASFAFSGINTQSIIEEILSVDSRDDFKFDEMGLEWNGHRVSNVRLSQIRQKYAISFGSCSYTEPVSELQESLS